MSVDLGTLVAGLIPIIGGVVWMVRLEGRINVTDSRFVDIIARLERIEFNQDRRQGRRHSEEPS